MKLETYFLVQTVMAIGMMAAAIIYFLVRFGGRFFSRINDRRSYERSKLLKMDRAIVVFGSLRLKHPEKTAEEILKAMKNVGWKFDYEVIETLNDYIESSLEITFEEATPL